MDVVVVVVIEKGILNWGEEAPSTTTAVDAECSKSVADGRVINKSMARKDF